MSCSIDWLFKEIHNNFGFCFLYYWVSNPPRKYHVVHAVDNLRGRGRVHQRACAAAASDSEEGHCAGKRRIDCRLCSTSAPNAHEATACRLAQGTMVGHEVGHRARAGNWRTAQGTKSGGGNTAATKTANRQQQQRRRC